MANPSGFYNAVYSTAIELGANDVQARLAAAQASEETGFGKSMVGNNLFGIKGGSDYVGPTVSAGTNEEYNGQMQREQANFRAYDDFKQSVGDYLDVISNNFPDAWSAETFSDAVKGLNSGVYGKYASNSDYASNITTIDNKYGAISYAQNPQNVPVPSSASDDSDLAGIPDDVTNFPAKPAPPIDPEFAYAASPANVPTPYSSGDQINDSDVAAFSSAPKTEDPFSSILSGNVPVTPALTPTVEGWSDMAAAKPIQAPMDSVQASGILSGNAPMAAATTAATTPTGGVLSGDPVSQYDISRALTNPNAASQFDPAFAEGLMGPNSAVVPNAVQTTSVTPQGTTASKENRISSLANAVAESAVSSRFATPAKTSRIGSLASPMDAARIDPLTGVIDPGTNTNSFSSDTGILSATTDRVMPNTAPQFTSDRFASPATTSRIGTLPGLNDYARMNPLTGAIDPSTNTQSFMNAPSAPASSILSSNLPTQAISAPVATPQQQAAGYGQLQAAPGLTNLSGGSLYDIDLSGNVVPTPQYTPAEQVADQPSVASIEGPTTTPALDQQQTQTVANTVQAARPQPTVQAAQNTKSFKDSVLSKETALGSILGGVVAGPPGAILGGLVGQQTAQGGGLTGLLSGGGFMAPTTQIGGGLANIAGIYGGQYSPGTYSVASNGATVTAQPGGYTGYTNKYGVSETISPTGQISHNFGSLFGGNAPATPDAAV